MDLEQERTRLLTELGDLLSPIRRFLEDGSPPNHVPHLRAQYGIENTAFQRRMAPFAGFAYEIREVRKALEQFDPLFTNMAGGWPKEEALRHLDHLTEQARERIARLPVTPLRAVFPEHSPFSFYLWLRAACANAKVSLVIVDAYLSADIFYRYLDCVQAEVMVTLVTIQGRAKGWDAFVSVAKLFLEEHPLEVRHDPDLHERYVVVDGTAWALTASIKDAADKASVEVTPAASANHVQELIEAATSIDL